MFVSGKHLETGLTKNNYLDIAKAILALLSIVLGVFLLRRDRHSWHPAQECVPRNTSSFTETCDRLAIAIALRYSQRPIRIIVIVVTILATPIGLRIAALGGGWGVFGMQDWISVGIVELLFLAVGFFVTYRIRELKKRNRG
jgi:hypothetical protein